MALQFFVNGTLVKEDHAEQNSFLANYLRRKVGLTGTKVACGEGGCGSCTVLLSKFDSQSQTFTHNAINACITPLSSIHGSHILTIEGVGGGSNTKSCHFLQDAIAQGNGTQCGFCTPGMVMSAHALTCSNKNPNVDEIKEALQGNLCRCTGYRPILEAFKKCSETPIEELPKCTPCLEDKRDIKLEATTNVSRIEMLLKSVYQNTITGDLASDKSNVHWLRPDSLSNIIFILKKLRDVKIVGGFTELAMTNQEKTTAYVYTGEVPQMRVAQAQDTCVRLGGALTISEMDAKLKDVVSRAPDWQTRSLRTILKLIEKFGSTQIRNAATLGGSIMTNNPASDIQTLFTALKCRADWYNRDNKTQAMTLVQDIELETSALVIAVEVPFNEKTQFTWAHKVIRRNVNDAAIMNFAIMVTLDEALTKVEEVCLTLGGRVIKRIHFNMEFKGEHTVIADGGFLKELVSLVQPSISPKQNEDSSYCQTLAKNLCVKFCNWLRKEIKIDLQNTHGDIKRGFKSTQTFDLTSDDQLPTDLVGRPIPHASAYKHATGEARFLDDIPKQKNELALAFILSKRPHAYVKSIDVTKALALKGVVGFVSSKDISTPERNYFGLVIKDEEIFASAKVNCVGQFIGGIAAKSRAIAKQAVELVQVEYEDLEPIITIGDAIKHNSYYEDFGMKLESGNCEQDFGESQTLTGNFKVGTQAHFYMEPQGCLAIPNGEDGEMEIISSTQNPMDTQSQAANVLEIPANRIVVKVKRIGGGFGGKEARSLAVALPVAVAAKKFKAPVRSILDRRTDMLVSGKRNHFEVDYSITFDKRGKIFALRLKLYCNAGHSLDVSVASMERAVMNVDNTYNIPNFIAEGLVCKTNISSNTVFRGTGAPQAALIIENILDHVASFLGNDPIQVRKINLYAEGDITPYGQTLNNSTIHQCWDECLRASNYYKRLAEIEEFNKNNEWRKRGISLNPTHFGVAYTALFLNQASALVHIYRDGSVSLSHGGVEIGQGLHSKMIQVATRALGVSSDKIRIIETATDKVPNATPTSASSSSDLNGMAVIDACQKLVRRLEPFKAANPNLSWEELVMKAYLDRTSLSATGFYKMPGIGWNEVTKKGNPFNYFSTGVACTEVELDCLTGQHQLLRTDIVMDVGKSLNPAIDLGQVEGAFMQGVGFYTMEDLKLDKDGAVETLGPNTYKIPTASDIPLEFNVSFLSGASNPKAVYSSKSVGEPPLLLATSAFFAIKDAIRRKVKSPVFELNSPATVEKILMTLQQ